VKVEIITPGPDIDAQAVRAVGKTRWRPLLEAGAHFYEYIPARFHSKYLIVDDCWTSVGSANFDTRSNAIIKQYDAYEPLPGLHVIGANTVGENLADNAGLVIAYRAYKLSLNGRPAPVIDGLTGDQRFFLGFGQIWRSLQRENAIRTQTLSNEHAVEEFRVIGTVRNMDAWYDAFGVKPGEKYYLAPQERVHLW